MPLAYWCVLIAALMPYGLVAYAKSNSRNNYNPRDAAEKIEGARRRAYAAHQNGFETFPFFAAAVIIAITMGASVSTVNWLAVVYIVLRLGYVYCYLANLATPRSLVWFGAFLVNVAIFVLPAFR